MALFDNCNLEEFLLFVQNFKIMLKALGTLAASANLQYLRMILCGKVLCKVDALSDHLGNTNTTHLNLIVFGLGMYLFLWMLFQIKNTQTYEEWEVRVN